MIIDKLKKIDDFTSDCNFWEVYEALDKSKYDLPEKLYEEYKSIPHHKRSDFPVHDPDFPHIRDSILRDIAIGKLQPNEINNSLLSIITSGTTTYWELASNDVVWTTDHLIKYGLVIVAIERI